MTQTENSPIAAHDPEHDVDGIKTSVAVFGSLLLIVITIWATSHLFSLMVQVERKSKIHDNSDINVHRFEDRVLS